MLRETVLLLAFGSFAVLCAPERRPEFGGSSLVSSPKAEFVESNIGSRKWRQVTTEDETSENAEIPVSTMEPDSDSDEEFLRNKNLSMMSTPG